MDRYTAVARKYEPHENRSNANWKLVDRFGPDDKGRDRMGYTYKDLEGRGWKDQPRSVLYHTPLEAQWRQDALNAGHLRAWIETNYPTVWGMYVIQRKPRSKKPLICNWPYTERDIKDRRREFGWWLKRNRPDLIARFEMDTERRIKQYEAKE